MNLYWMTTDGYSICRGNACEIKRNAKKLERLMQGTVVCDECGRYIPANGRNYKPSVTEEIMSEHGLVQWTSRRLAVEQRRAFRRALSTTPRREAESFQGYTARLVRAASQVKL